MSPSSHTFTAAPAGWCVWHITTATAVAAGRSGPIWWQPLAGWLTDKIGPEPVIFGSDGAWINPTELSEFMAITGPRDPFNATIVAALLADHQRAIGEPVDVGDVPALVVAAERAADDVAHIAATIEAAADEIASRLEAALSGIGRTLDWAGR